MNPGATINPPTSNFSFAPPLVLLGGATSITCPSRNRTSIGASTLFAGSITCPPLINSEAGLDLLFGILNSGSRTSDLGFWLWALGFGLLALALGLASRPGLLAFGPRLTAFCL